MWPIRIILPPPVKRNLKLYLARVTSIGEMEPDGEEEMEMEREIVPLQEALEMIDDGQIVDAKTIIGLLLTERWLSRS